MEDANADRHVGATLEDTLNADVLLVQNDVKALLCVELHFVLVSGPDATL